MQLLLVLKCKNQNVYYHLQKAQKNSIQDHLEAYNKYITLFLSIRQESSHFISVNWHLPIKGISTLQEKINHLVL
jgi:hypothetical protein